MTKDMAKAIRLVNGFNPDLRVKLDRYAHREKIQNFMFDHLLDLYGVNIVDQIGVSFNYRNDPVEYAQVSRFVEAESAWVCF